MTDNGIMTGSVSPNELALLNFVPQVLRARDFRLYTKDGRRLIDLWQNGGAAVLGHTPPLLLREIKNTASRGLYAPFPHFSEQRFIKALSVVLPGMSFRIYAAPPSKITDNAACHCVMRHNFMLWRPFLDFCPPAGVKNTAEEKKPPAAAEPPAGKKMPADSPLVIPVLPGIQGWRNGLPLGLCVCAVPADCEEEFFNQFPPGDLLPPVLLAAATRGIYDLIAAAPERANIQWQRINKIPGTSPWQRRGIYLFLRNSGMAGGSNGADSSRAGSGGACGKSMNPELWAILFRRFLDAGFLLPPAPEHPLILPGILSPGEEAKLAEILSRGLPESQ